MKEGKDAVVCTSGIEMVHVYPIAKVLPLLQLT